MQFFSFLLIFLNASYIVISVKLKAKSNLKEKSKQSTYSFSPFQGSDNLVFNSQEGRNEYDGGIQNIDYNHHFKIKPTAIRPETATIATGNRVSIGNMRTPIFTHPKTPPVEMPTRPCVNCNVKKVEDVVQKVYNPVPVMTHYNMPVLHHIPINEVVKKYIPVYYPIPIEHKINIPVKVPIKIPQRVLIPQAVPYGVKVPVPVPYKVEIPQYKEIEVKKPLYVKIPVYEHIPIYHHFLVKDKQKQKKQESPNETTEEHTEIMEEYEEKSSSNEINKQSENFLSKKNRIDGEDE